MLLNMKMYLSLQIHCPCAWDLSAWANVAFNISSFQRLLLQDLLNVVKFSALLSIEIALTRAMLTCKWFSAVLFSASLPSRVSKNQRLLFIVFHCLIQLTPVYHDEITLFQLRVQSLWFCFCQLGYNSPNCETSFIIFINSFRYS